MGRQDRQRGWGGGASGWTAFESFGAATHVLTGDGLIVEANPAFERMFGAARTAFYGAHQADLAAGSPAARQRVAGRLLREAGARGTWEGILENRARDGRRFATRAHVYPVRVDGRRYFVCIQEEADPTTAATPLRTGASPWRSVTVPG